MEKKFLKSTARLLNRKCVNRGGLDLSKEILWVSVGQKAADLQAVKVGGQQKNFADWLGASEAGSNQAKAAKIFFYFQI